AIAGVLPDGRQLVNRAREEASSYKRNFGVEIPGKILAQRVALFVHAYTEYWHLRPFGVSCLVATCDENDGPQLYLIDPSGDCRKFQAIAVGKGQQPSRVQLEKIDFQKITCKEAVNKVAQMFSFFKKIFVQSINIIDFFFSIYSIHDDVKDKPFDLELSWVLNDPKKLILLCSFVYLIGALKTKKIHVWMNDRYVFVPQDVLSQAKDAGAKQHKMKSL
ncbi:proteasome subunit alpha, partial [Reticulomyxa filosa]